MVHQRLPANYTQDAILHIPHITATLMGILKTAVRLHAILCYIIVIPMFTTTNISAMKTAGASQWRQAHVTGGAKLTIRRHAPADA